MSSAAVHIHPLILRLREQLANDDFLTHQRAATEIGVSLRTLTYWVNTDTVPKKRNRQQIADWLDSRNGQAA